MSSFLDRVAGAPITWGVDGTPGWGHIMDRDRVLAEMATIGLAATELGPDGWLPIDPDELTDFVAGYEMEVVGGFVPAVLYRSDLVEGELEYVERASRQFAQSGARVMVLGPASHVTGYDTSIDMDDEQWRIFLHNLDRLREVAGGHGLETAVHQHWGMAVERRSHVERLLESCDVGLCLDTGHMFLVGIDPVDIARDAGERIRHVHLKDLGDADAGRVRSGEVAFRDAVVGGMFKPLGSGDVDVSGVIRQLEAVGYNGWYVLEQDASLASEPAPGDGPRRDAVTSLEFLRDLASDL